jgi:4-carboxymuconolactone decarboxylase
VNYYTRKGLTNAEREFLIKAILQNIPYIGYPRSLNALPCVDNAAEELRKK